MVVDAVSVYGTANAGVRARVMEFLERLDVECRLHNYFPGNSAHLRQFLRSPQRAATAEVRLRRLARQQPSRILLRREASPLSKGGIEERLLRMADHGVYDIDDALHEDTRGVVFEALFSKGGKAARAAAAADTVIVGNEFLADWASDRNDDVRIIPTCVDPSAYTRKTKYDIGARPKLLWLGTASGEQYLASIGDALVRLHRELGATLTIIGDPQCRLGDLEKIIHRIPWTLAFAQTTLADYDIGLMPLADTAYERGKCAYKLLEYGAAGLPAIASPVGVNRHILTEAGCPAPQSGDEWYSMIVGMIEAGSRDRAGTAASLRSLVERDFSFARWLPAWRMALGLDGNPSGPTVVTP